MSPDEIKALVAQALSNHCLGSDHATCVCGRWSESYMGPDWDDHMAEVTFNVLNETGLLTEPPAPGTEVTTEYRLQMHEPSITRNGADVDHWWTRPTVYREGLVTFARRQREMRQVESTLYEHVVRTTAWALSIEQP